MARTSTTPATVAPTRPRSMTRTTRLLVALGANVVLVAAQVGAGIGAHSTSLISDAGHNLTDVAGIALSLFAVRWAMRPRSDTRSFGNHRSTILAALVNSAALAAVTVGIVVVSIVRLVHPRPVDGTTMIVVAAVAVVVNLAAALVLRDRDHTGHTHDLNMRANVLHMAGDTAASGCVVLAGVIIAIGGSGWDRIDPIASLLVAALIVAEAIRLTKASVDVLLESTPKDLSLDDLRKTITDTQGVQDVHDLHVWSLSSDVRALSAHLVLTGHPSLEEAQRVGGSVRRAVEGPFEIAHSTFELECESCVDEEEDPCGIDELSVRTASAVRVTVTGSGRDVTPSNRSAEASRAPRGHAHR